MEKSLRFMTIDGLLDAEDIEFEFPHDYDLNWDIKDKNSLAREYCNLDLEKLTQVSDYILSNYRIYVRDILWRARQMKKKIVAEASSLKKYIIVDATPNCEPAVYVILAKSEEDAVVQFRLYFGEINENTELKIYCTDDIKQDCVLPFTDEDTDEDG